MSQLWIQHPCVEYSRVSNPQSFAPDADSGVVPIEPTGAQCIALLAALRRGERLTMLDALERYQVAACSQRMGELKKLGHPVKSRMVTTATGKRVSEYWL